MNSIIDTIFSGDNKNKSIFIYFNQILHLNIKLKIFALRFKIKICKQYI